MNTDKIYAEQLANEYALKDTSKVVALRKLDKKAKLPATVFTYTFGIIAALIVGVGMCLSMKIIGSGTTAMFVLGLQTAMLSRFSENGESYRKMMNAITGRFVYGIVILNAVLMLLHNIKIRKKVKSIE